MPVDHMRIIGYNEPGYVYKGNERVSDKVNERERRLFWQESQLNLNSSEIKRELFYNKLFPCNQ